MTTPRPTTSAVTEEMNALGRQLGAAMRTLQGLGPVEVGASPKSVVHRVENVALYRFRPQLRELQPVPLLIVYALANRHYMTDLQEDRSLVRGLLARGVDVYLIDWGYPRPEDCRLRLEDYLCRYLDECVGHICRERDLRCVNLLGICQGGTFSLCYAALHPERVHALVTMVTPVDFHTPDNLLSHWVRHIDVDLLVDTLGNVPGELLNWMFLSLKPYQLGGQKYLDMLPRLSDPETARNFLRMERWIHDSPPQAGEAFRQFVKDCYQGNKLVRGEMRLGGRVVDLRRVTAPVLNIYADADHIVPPSASRPLADLVGSKDYDEVVFRGGHIGVYVSRRAQREVPPRIAGWLADR